MYRNSSNVSKPFKSPFRKPAVPIANSSSGSNNDLSPKDEKGKIMRLLAQEKELDAEIKALEDENITLSTHKVLKHKQLH